MKLRTKMPAATTSTTVTATCAASSTMPRPRLPRRSTRRPSALAERQVQVDAPREQRRHQAEDDGGQAGERKRRQAHARVDRDLTSALEESGGRSGDRMRTAHIVRSSPSAPPGTASSAPSTSSWRTRAPRPPPSAPRSANSRPAAQRAREHQPRDVDAGEEHHEPGRDEEEVERPPVVSAVRTI